MTYSGRDRPDKINCFTLFVDSICKKIFVHFQHSTSTEETLLGKQLFEHLAYQYNVTIKKLSCIQWHIQISSFQSRHQQEQAAYHLLQCRI
jgi:hypothetical protein